MRQHANRKTVIIGGGVIGLSVAYHLGKLGKANVVLLERNQLSSGTSWHAAGIVGPLRSSQNLTELARYAIELFADLEQETGQSTGYRQTGGLWLAQKPARLVELKRIAAMGEMNRLETQILSAAETRARFDLARVDDLVGSMWVGEDGQVNPVDLCMAYARGARLNGVKIQENSGVRDLELKNDCIDAVILDSGDRIEVDAVINCAGLWAGEIGRMAGVSVPLRAVEHMYVITEQLDGLPDPCPVVRDLDSGIYIKGDAGKLVLGTFEANARLWDPSSVQHNRCYLEFEADWDHAEPMLNAGIARLPVLETVGIRQFMNGPESFTPDSRQIMGRMPEVQNMYVAAGFNSIGIMSSAGVGKVMAQWVRDQHPPMDLWEVDIARFDQNDGDSDFLDQRIPEAVHNQFQMHWPFRQYETGRGRKVSPWHDVMAEYGAVFGAPTGWERPLWFAGSESDRELVYSYGEQCWWPFAEREARQMMNAGAVFELSPFSKFLLTGANVDSGLQMLCSNSIHCDVGDIVYTLMLNARGGIEADCTVTRLAHDCFMVVTGAATRTRDYHWINNHIGPNTLVEDITDQYGVLGIMGPRSRDLLAKVTRADFSASAFRFSTSRMVTIADARIRANRISYVGELGWELFVPKESAGAVISAITENMDEFGIGFAGHFCLDSCRLEKGYVHWGHDIGPDNIPAEAGLEFAVKLHQNFNFIGKQALLHKSSQPLQFRRVLFEICCERTLLLHDEPIYRNGKWVGRTTSGGLGFRTGKALSMGYIKLTREGLKGNFEIKVAGEQFKAIPFDHVPYDRLGSKLRS